VGWGLGMGPLSAFVVDGLVWDVPSLEYVIESTAVIR
jgi:hypothetical protein